MIGNTMQFIAKQLNNELLRKLKLPAGQKKVIVSSILHPDGSMAVKDKNVIVLTLINIIEDSAAKNIKVSSGGTEASSLSSSPPIFLQLDIMISAYFEETANIEGMNVLFMIIQYLQDNPLWSHHSFSGLPSGMDKINFQMVSLDFQQLYHLWSTMGVNYMPSALYRMKMITLAGDPLSTNIPSISSTISNKSS